MSILKLNHYASPTGISKPPFGSTLDWDNPMLRNMVHCYLCNEGGGTVLHDSYRTNFNGSTGAVAGWINEAPHGLVVDSGPSIANTVVSDITYTTNLTVEIWVKCINASALKGIAYFGNSGSSGYGLFQSNGAGAAGTLITLLLGGSNNNAFSSGSYTVEQNVWRQFILTRDATTWTFYVDTVSKATGTANPIAVVSASQFSESANSKKALFRMWNRVISTAEMAELFHNPYGMFIAPHARMFLPSSGKFFRPSNLDGLSVGGPFFANPLG